MYLEEENSNDEIIKGQPLREVAVVEVEEEQCKDENEVLPRELRPRQPNDLQTSHCHNYGRTTAAYETEIDRHTHVL